MSELEALHLVGKGHTITFVAPVAPSIASRLRRADVGIYDCPVDERTAVGTGLTLGDLDIVHCHCMVSAPFAAELARKTGAALVLHNHNMGEEWWECSTKRSWLHPARRRRRQRIDAAVAAAERVLCVSQPVLDHMRALGLRTDRALVVPNPISDEFFSDESGGGYTYDICIVARASRQKRPISTLQILSRAKKIDPSLRIVWLGRLGRWAQVLKGSSMLFGLSGVEYRGAVQPSVVRSTLDSSRVLLSASKHEGEPLAVLEAMARGCSVFLSDILAHRSAFSGIEGAHFFANGDAEAAARELVEVVHEHVRRPREWLAMEHSTAAHGERIEQVYRQALAERDADRVATTRLAI